MSKCSPLPQPSPPLIASYSISPSSPASCTTAPSSRDRLESLYGSPPSSPPSAPPPPSVLFDEGQEHPKLGTRRQCCEPSALLSREARGKRQAITRWIIVFISLSLALLLWAQLWIENGEDLIDAQKNAISGSPDIEALSLPRVPSARNDKYTAVRRWLRENSYNRYAFEWEADQRPLWRRLLLSNPYRLIYPISPRPKAAIISLVRNEELQGIMQSMRQLELRWNWKYRYPWIFFSETGFSEEFKAATRNITSSATSYELIPREHWSIPPSVDRSRLAASLDYLGGLGVGKGHLLSYRHMCRWNSMFFYHHPALAGYDFYWRVEPDVHFFCDVDYDPFRMLRDNGLVYGFNMLILDDARSFPNLFSLTREFVTTHPEFFTDNDDAGAAGNLDDMADWLIDPRTGEYNNCQFFSNFEVGDLNFFRAAQGHDAYVRWLDGRRDQNGFFYSRFGDAPVHTLSLALFAGRHRVWFMRDLGYQHDIARHCPADHVYSWIRRRRGRRRGDDDDDDDDDDGGGESTTAPQLPLRPFLASPDQSAGGYGRCTCEPTSLDSNFYKLVPMESPQRKPEDTCIRLFLHGEDEDEGGGQSWKEKKPGWDAEVERMFGGDGYGGYLHQG